MTHDWHSSQFILVYFSSLKVIAWNVENNRMLAGTKLFLYVDQQA